VRQTSPDRSLGRMLTTQVKKSAESPAAGFSGFSVDSMRRSSSNRGQQAPGGCRLSTLVCIDGAASVAERAFDLLAPAALSTVAAKTTEHMIEDIVAMPGFMTFWACQFPIAVAVRARGLRHDPCSFPCFALNIWERGAPIDTRVNAVTMQTYITSISLAMRY